MLKIAVCDDERIIREEIIRSLNEYSRLRNIDIICDSYENGYDFLRTKRSYNIVFLDYMFDKDLQLNGLSIAKKLRNNNQDIAIIFLTSYPKVVFSSFEVDTFRFLVKPLDVQKLYTAMDDFLNTLDTDKTLMIRIDGAVNIINTKQIIYLEGDGKYCLIHTNEPSQSIECRETLASVEKRLPEHIFCRCHRSFIVNLQYIQSYDHQEIILRNGAQAYISRHKYNLFEAMFFDYTKRYGY